MINYREIAPSEFLDQIKHLLHAHWLECEQDLAPGPGPDAYAYKTCEDAGITVAFGVFDDSVMIGYGVAFVHRHLHYDMLHAQHDTLFIEKSYRKGRTAIILQKLIEEGCRLKGAKWIAWHAKKGSQFDRLLQTMQYQESETVYVKDL